MLGKLLTISKNTFLESIRQPVFVVLLVAGCLILFFNPSFSAYTMDDDNKLMIDMGLSTVFVIGLAISAFTATGVLSAEVENRTVLTVVSKPVPRPVFVVGKFLGVASALSLAFWIMTCLLLLTVRHKVMQTASAQFDQPVITFGVLAWLLAALGSAFANYFYRRVFASTFIVSLAVLMGVALLLVLFVGPGWKFQGIAAEFGAEGCVADGQILWVLLLVFEAQLVLTAAAIAASTRLGQMMTMVICFVLFFISVASETTLGALIHKTAWTDVRGPLESAGYLLAKLSYFILPNLQFLWLADALPQGLHVTAGHVALLSAYALIETLAILGLAVALFQTREVG